MNKVWQIQPKKSSDLKLQLLMNRGLTKKEDIENFFNPQEENFQNIFKIPEIKKAQKRIKEAIQKGELIIVYGDYDVDGVCASAIVYKSLSSLGAKILPYIPHREKEGYGLSKQGLEFSRDSGASLVITVDHGIVALEEALYAKKIGLDLIITDHHAPREKKPQAFSIVHSTTICGAAVAWCLVREIIEPRLSEQLLELVALATVCDLMPLLGINRFFVNQGLYQINKTKSVGLLALINECGITGEVDSYALGHYLGPRLNAIGRLEHAIDALRLLCTKDSSKARKLARFLSDANIKRRELTQIALEEAKLMIDKTAKVHILHSKDWIPGIIGLIAGRVTEEMNTPSIAISVGEIHSKGSARSINGINIVETIRKCESILVDIGGHKGAAGFTIETKRIEEFKKKLQEVFRDLGKEEPVLQIEAEVSAKELTKTLVKEIKSFEPFGFGNPEPILATRAMKISDIRTVGEGKHLKFKAEGIDAIAFGKGEMKVLLKEGQLIDLAYCLQINKFNGSETLQLNVKDIAILSLI